MRLHSRLQWNDGQQEKARWLKTGGLYPSLTLSRDSVPCSYLFAKETLMILWMHFIRLCARRMIARGTTARNRAVASTRDHRTDSRLNYCRRPRRCESEERVIRQKAGRFDRGLILATGDVAAAIDESGRDISTTEFYCYSFRYLNRCSPMCNNENVKINKRDS